MLKKLNWVNSRFNRLFSSNYGGNSGGVLLLRGGVEFELDPVVAITVAFVAARLERPLREGVVHGGVLTLAMAVA